ncbi:MAG: hypothetical protein IKM21_02725, partial [Oscillospiraceae bacterium]|nr:hypothetical protein [Oscillospiraceae bacterium]
EPKPVDPNQKVPDAESFTLLIVGTDYRPDMYKDYYHTYEDIDKIAGGLKESGSTVGILGTKIRYINATWIALVRADKENREFVTTYISPETRVSSPSGDTTLGDVYGRYGLTVLCDHVEGLANLKVDHSIVIDGERGIEFISSMGSVRFELVSDIYSGGADHLSASTSVITSIIEESDPESESASESASDSESSEKVSDDPPEEANDDKKGKDDKNTAEDGDDPEEQSVATEIVDNVLVLEAGIQSLSDYSVHIVNTFKELSNEDVKVKSTMILDMVESYLRRCSDYTVDELKDKFKRLTWGQSGEISEYFSDPYATKPVFATNITSEDLPEIHAMLEALEYFDYIEYVYPVSYSEEDKVFIPDTHTALEFFAKYKNK